ncbi:hypothetical protein MACH24_02890 [Erythrobacter sp. Dej080120_24]|uniref:outer membrane protein n=1 Tax=Erythrobacter sp. Dej080120_24 TaxID=3024837 RepID=UPI00291F8B21|nr:hypothetical protein MACH24_02890 [Erythrobacter sp. Dej080120_24]
MMYSQDTIRTVKPLGVGLAALAASLAMLATASPTHAQSSDEHFQGVTIGAQAGWEDRTIDATVLPDTLNTALDDSRDGFAYAGYVGYDHQLDRFVIGVEAGFAPGGKTLRADIPGGSIELDSKWSADLSVRGGVTVTERLLAYGRVGYALNRYRIRGFATGTTAPVASDGETADGVIFGGGLEYALSDNASVRAEYRRKELDGSLSSNQVLGGVTLRF